ncbi:MAG: glutathione S-transferase family protein [Myxococcota bacterium]
MALMIGNKNYSSWSLRPWLALRQSGLEFEEVRVALGSPEFADRVRPWSPAGKVPVLRHENVYVWDSLAICEYLADSFAERQLWPREPQRRALARAASAEMHSGFQSLRAQMPMNVRARGRRVRSTPELEQDVARVREIWSACRRQAGSRGPFLFGAFTIADAMYAPVAFRFATYGVQDDYAESLVQLPAMREWAAAAAAEPETIESSEVGR